VRLHEDDHDAGQVVVAVFTGEPGWYVPAGADWCPRCGDRNWDGESRLCITCSHGDDVSRGVR
jgi:hypothetical protein